MFRDNLTGRGPKNFRRSDRRIREDVCDALTAHPEVDASGMEVEVEEGVVRLHGEIESRRAKRLAEECAERSPGVKDIRNELRVRGMNLNPVARGDAASAGEERLENTQTKTPTSQSGSDYLQ